MANEFSRDLFLKSQQNYQQKTKCGQVDASTLEQLDFEKGKVHNEACIVIQNVLKKASENITNSSIAELEIKKSEIKQIKKIIKQANIKCDDLTIIRQQINSVEKNINKVLRKKRKFLKKIKNVIKKQQLNLSDIGREIFDKSSISTSDIKYEDESFKTIPTQRIARKKDFQRMDEKLTPKDDLTQIQTEQKSETVKEILKNILTDTDKLVIYVDQLVKYEEDKKRFREEGKKQQREERIERKSAIKSPIKRKRKKQPVLDNIFKGGLGEILKTTMAAGLGGITGTILGGLAGGGLLGPLGIGLGMGVGGRGGAILGGMLGLTKILNMVLGAATIWIGGELVYFFNEIFKGTHVDMTRLGKFMNMIDDKIVSGFHVISKNAGSLAQEYSRTTPIIGPIIGGLAGLVVDIMENFVWAFGKAKEKFNDIKTSLLNDKIPTIIAKIKDGLVKLFDDFQELYQTMIENFKELYDKLKNKFKNTYNKITSKVKGWVQDVKESDIYQKTKKIAQKTKKWGTAIKKSVIPSDPMESDTFRRQTPTGKENIQNMKTSERGIEFIKQREGFSPTAYWDNKQFSIGYGSGKTKGRVVQPGDTVTKEQAEKDLQNELPRYENMVKRRVEVPLTQNQFDALVSFTYNLGERPTATLWKKINTEDYAGAIKEFPKWRLSKGKVSEGLVKRRKLEAEIFSTPIPEPAPIPAPILKQQGETLLEKQQNLDKIKTIQQAPVIVNNNNNDLAPTQNPKIESKASAGHPVLTAGQNILGLT